MKNIIKVINEKDINSINKVKELVVGTHNGIFHCDEVLAIAMLGLLIKDIGKVNVIRSRDIKYLEDKTDFLVDIGGGKFDHHQKGGNGERDNKIKYASAGLIWKEFGRNIVKKISNENLDQNELEKIAKEIDEEIVQNVDKEDNGQSVSNHQFSFITDFLPIWNKDNNYDQNFEECANHVVAILNRKIEQKISQHLAQREIYNIINNPEKHINNILMLPCQTIPWQNILINFNDALEEKIDFVVFPYPDGGYALQCVPPNEEEIFSKRIPLPKEWAGETTELPKISGVQSAIFCHNGRFFARAKEYNDIIKMCQLATDNYLREESKNETSKRH